MKKAGVAAVTVAILTLVLVSAGCGGETTEATRWVTVIEDGRQINPSGEDSKGTMPFELTGAPCRMRYETVHAPVLRVYIVPQDEPTKRQSVLDMRNRSPNTGAGETAIYVEPGTYHLEIEGLDSSYRYQLWVEEQR